MLGYSQIDPVNCEFVGVAQASDLPNGERLYLTIDDLPIVVFNIAGGYYAIADLCSHDDGPLGDGELDGLEIICPRHGARFDIRNGKVLSLPAIVNIPAYPVRILDGEIQVGIPQEH
jgi:3-phenylpropionate/trans-cinnamate dioxygenase ferredoxin component